MIPKVVITVQPHSWNQTNTTITPQNNKNKQNLLIVGSYTLCLCPWHFLPIEKHLHKDFVPTDVVAPLLFQPVTATHQHNCHHAQWTSTFVKYVAPHTTQLVHYQRNNDTRQTDTFSVSEWVSEWVSEQCFTSPPTQYRLYGRRFFQKTQPTVSMYWRKCYKKERKQRKQLNTHIHRK